MLTPFTVFTPGNIRFGRGLAGSAAPWLAQRAAKVLLVHGASPQRAALLLAELRAHHLAVVTLAVAHEPTLEDIEQGVRLAREHAIDAVVSLGGGAVIDAGNCRAGAGIGADR
jgi:alcohol dehydrogenase class IV